MSNQEDPKTGAGAARELDLRGYRCPVPVVKTEAALASAAAGQVFVVLADDPIAALDIPHYCSEAGHACERLADRDGACVFRVTRT